MNLHWTPDVASKVMWPNRKPDSSESRTWTGQTKTAQVWLLKIRKQSSLDRMFLKTNPDWLTKLRLPSCCIQRRVRVSVGNSHDNLTQATFQTTTGIFLYSTDPSFSWRPAFFNCFSLNSLTQAHAAEDLDKLTGVTDCQVFLESNIWPYDWGSLCLLPYDFVLHWKSLFVPRMLFRKNSLVNATGWFNPRELSTGEVLIKCWMLWTLIFSWDALIFWASLTFWWRSSMILESGSVWTIVCKILWAWSGMLANWTDSHKSIMRRVGPSIVTSRSSVNSWGIEADVSQAVRIAQSDFITWSVSRNAFPREWCPNKACEYRCGGAVCFDKEDALMPMRLTM